MIRRFISSVKRHLSRLGGKPAATAHDKRHPHDKPAAVPDHPPQHHDRPRTHTAQKAAPRVAEHSTPRDAAPSDGQVPRRRRRRRGRGSGGQAGTPSHQRAAAPDAGHAAPVAPAAPPWDLASFVIQPREGATRFHDLDLPPEIMQAVSDLGFSYCTPIQAAILPAVLAGSDAAGRAQTGTGKTAAFLIGILTRFLRSPLPVNRPHGAPRAFILAPTRELAAQINKDCLDLVRHTPFTCATIFGGMDYNRQRRALTDAPVDIVSGTPGRILDFLRNRVLDLRHVEVAVIDEADRMLDMGFIPDVRSIMRAIPTERQTMLFSATLTPTILRLAAQWTRNPVMVEIEPEHVTLDSTDQIAYIIKRREKFPLIYNLITKRNLQRVLVFANRRDESRRLADELRARGINCALLSGDVSQTARFSTLEKFRAGEINVIVATDVAARGLHVDAISHVINYNLPDDPEVYVHRIGRTGRAGASGISISFASEDDGHMFPALQDFIGRELRCVYPEPELLEPPPAPQRSHVHDADRGSAYGHGHSGSRPRRHGRRSGGGSGPHHSHSGSTA